jgi:hypothetical protein
MRPHGQGVEQLPDLKIGWYCLGESMHRAKVHETDVAMPKFPPSPASFAAVQRWLLQPAAEP